MLSRAKNLLEHVHTFFAKMICPGWGSNSRPSDYETDALPTALPRQLHRNLSLVEKYRSKRQSCKCLKNASAGNRTRINCLEGSYANHYTTDASWAMVCKDLYKYLIYEMYLFLKILSTKIFTYLLRLSRDLEILPTYIIYELVSNHIIT